jgi:hypothetical protein
MKPFMFLLLSITLVVVSSTLGASQANRQAQTDKDPQAALVAAALKVAETRVKIVQTDLDLAVVEEQYYAKEFDRAGRLKVGNAIPDTDFRVAWKNHYSSKHRLAKARARLEEAKAMVEYVRVTGDTDKSLPMP